LASFFTIKMYSVCCLTKDVTIWFFAPVYPSKKVVQPILLTMHWNINTVDARCTSTVFIF